MPKKKAKKKTRKTKKRKTKKKKTEKTSLAPKTEQEKEKVQEKPEWIADDEGEIFGEEAGEEQEEFDDWGLEEDEELR